MGNGYTPGYLGDEDRWRVLFQSIERRLSELERPTATQIYGTTGHADALQGATVVPVGLNSLVTPTITATLTEFATISTPVPAGCSRAIVTVIASAGLSNSGAAGSWANLIVSPGIGGAGANTRRISVPGGQFGSVESSATQLLTGLSGGTINVGAFVSFADTYTVQSVSVSGSILFLV